VTCFHPPAIKQTKRRGSYRIKAIYGIKRNYIWRLIVSTVVLDTLEIFHNKK
jgi:hypothetical protein